MDKLHAQFRHIAEYHIRCREAQHRQQSQEDPVAPEPVVLIGVSLTLPSSGSVFVVSTLNPHATVDSEVILFLRIIQAVITVSVAREQVLALSSLDCVIGERGGATDRRIACWSLHLNALMLRSYL